MAILSNRIGRREYPRPEILKENRIVTTSNSRHDFRYHKKSDREQFLVQLSIELRKPNQCREHPESQRSVLRTNILCVE